MSARWQIDFVVQSLWLAFQSGHDEATVGACLQAFGFHDHAPRAIPRAGLVVGFAELTLLLACLGKGGFGLFHQWFHFAFQNPVATAAEDVVHIMVLAPASSDRIRCHRE
jgi:hypothetical protein